MMALLQNCMNLFRITIIALLISLLSPLNSIAVERTIPANKGQLYLSFSPIVKKTAPAVVNIYTQKKVKVRGFSPFLNDPFFQEFFGNSLQRSPYNRERIERSLGSGVIVAPEGWIITNYHVVQDSDQITVALSDKSEFEAKLVLSDEKTDLALLKIENTEPFPFLTLYDSDELEVGDIVLAIGNPFGVGQTVTSGIVSALARTTVGISDYQFFIQTDAAINPGNSGGALINSEGKLVGINTAIFSRSGGSNGIGFATPSNMVRTILNSKEHGGKIIRPWLGVSMQEVTSDIAASIGIKRPIGALISRIYNDSPADKAGLHVGDIILEVDGKEVENPHALQFRMATYQIGSRIPLTIIRNGRRKEIVIKASPPMEIPPRDIVLLQGNHLLKGAKVANLSPLLAEELRMNVIEKGVVIIDIENVSVANRIGFEPKDIILQVNDTKITSTKQLNSFMNKTVKDRAVRGWDIRIKRGERVIKMIVGK